MHIITQEDGDQLVVLSLGLVGSNCDTGCGNIKAANKMPFPRRFDCANLASHLATGCISELLLLLLFFFKNGQA